MPFIKNTRLAGLLLLTGMLMGIFSVAPAIDSTNYLTEAAVNSNQVIIAAVFQFAMSLAYIGFAVLLYPILRTFDDSLSAGFLSFRIIAVTLSIIGTLLLLSLLALSQEFVQLSTQNRSALETLGNVLKTTRDYINHVFMILVLCAGNFLLYALLWKSRLIPRWLSIWGLIGAALSAFASILVWFDLVGIISFSYLAFNAPTAIQELVLGFWLIVKGFTSDK